MNKWHVLAVFLLRGYYHYVFYKYICIIPGIHEVTLQDLLEESGRVIRFFPFKISREIMYSPLDKT